MKVPRLGPAAFTQCAGFLRIHGGKSPLDNTPVHPESYALAEKILQKLGFALKDLNNPDKLTIMKAKRRLIGERRERELAASLQPACRRSTTFSTPSQAQGATRAPTCRPR